MDITMHTTVETRKSVEMRLTGKQIIDLINRMASDLDIETRVPERAEVLFPVPGGADWSSTDLDIFEAHPVIVKWYEVTRG